MATSPKSFPTPLPQEEKDRIWSLVQQGYKQSAISAMTGRSISAVRRVERAHGFVRRPNAVSIGSVRRNFDLDTIEGAEAAIDYHTKQKERAEAALRAALQSHMDQIQQKLAELKAQDVVQAVAPSPVTNL